MKPILSILFLLATPAMAQDISDADKTAALKRGYEMNDRQSFRWGSIDLTAVLAAAITVLGVVLIYAAIISERSAQ